MNNQELKALIEASCKDIEYCKNEIVKLQENAKEYPVNAGYAAKETKKLELIIESHESRLNRYKSELTEETEIEFLEREINKEKNSIKDMPYSSSNYMKLVKLETKLDKLKKDELAKHFTGNKYQKCRRCSGTGMHCGGICYGCNGFGKKKTKKFRDFLGEDDLPF